MAEKAKKEPKETKTEETKKEPKVAESSKNEETEVSGNFVYIGKKGAMAYVLAVVTQFGLGAKEVVIKARGKSISRAVDVAEIVKNRDPAIKVVGINTSTEEVQTQEGRPLKVSSIEIIIKK